MRWPIFRRRPLRHAAAIRVQQRAGAVDAQAGSRLRPCLHQVVPLKQAGPVVRPPTPVVQRRQVRPDAERSSPARGFIPRAGGHHVCTRVFTEQCNPMGTLFFTLT